MFDYSYINHVMYPSGSGGKFLINCLSLNNKAVFQNERLAQQQLNGDFTIMDKLDYIHSHLEIAKRTGTWKDLSLGDFVPRRPNPDRYIDKFPDVVQNCIDNNLYLFTTVHNFTVLDDMLKIWTNGKLIVFKNYKNFTDTRTGNRHVRDMWNNIAGSDWCEAPTDLNLYNQLPEFIRNELANNFSNEIYKYLVDKEEQYFLWHVYLKKLSKSVDLFEFDVDYAYSNKKNFYKTYIQVSDYLNLPYCDQDIITEYFDAWKETLLSIN